MSLPSALEAVTVTQTYNRVDGSPCTQGFVLFAAYRAVAGGGVLFTDAPAKEYPDGNGTVSITVPAGTDADLSSPMFLRVKERLVDADPRDYTVQVPSGTATVTLHDLPEAVPPAPALAAYIELAFADGRYSKTADEGQPNGIATLGADGKLTPAQALVQSVNGKTGAVALAAGDVGSVAAPAATPSDGDLLGWDAAGGRAKAVPSTTYVHVGQTNVDAEGYGGDLSAAVAALPSGGGTVWLSRPSYSEASLSLAGRKSVHLRGTGSAYTEATTGTVPPTRVVMTTQGSGTAIDAQGAQSLKLTDLDITYTAGFTGTLIDARGQADPNAMFLPVIERCRIGGDYASNLRSAALLLHLGDTVEPTLRDVVFHDAVRAVKGLGDSGVTFATEALFSNCKFEGFTAAPILNPGTKWNFVDNTVFEPLFGGGAGAVECQVDADTLVFNGASFWDATVAGQWIDFKGSGLYILASRAELGTGIALVRFNGACTGGGIDFSSVKGAAGSLATYNSGASVSNWRVGEHMQIDLGVDSGSFRTPTATAGAGAGTGAAAPTVAGVDEAFSISLSTGAAPSDGVLAHVAYKVPFVAPPSVLLTAENIAAANGGSYHFYVQNRSASGFDIALHTGSTPPASLTGAWLLTAVSIGGRQTNA